MTSPFDPDVAVTHILVVADPTGSRDFWVDVLGADLYREYGSSVVLQLAGTWLLLVEGGEPTPDKPDVRFDPPADPSTVSHAMTLRVADFLQRWRLHVPLPQTRVVRAYGLYHPRHPAALWPSVVRRLASRRWRRQPR